MISDDLIKKLMAEINLSDITSIESLKNDDDQTWTDQEIKEIQKQSLENIKIRLSDQYLGDKSSSLQSNTDESNQNKMNEEEEEEEESKEDQSEDQSSKQSEEEEDQSGKQSEEEEDQSSDQSSKQSEEDQSEDQSSDQSEEEEDQSSKQSEEEEEEESEEEQSSDQSGKQSEEEEEEESEEEQSSDQSGKQSEEEEEEQSEEEDQSEGDQKEPDFNYQKQSLPNDMNEDQFENKLRQIAKQMLKTSYNITEDQRIESNTSKNQKGSELRFNKKNSQIGKLQYKTIDDINDPVKALHAVRQMRSDLVKQSKFKSCENYIHDVELKDRDGGLVLIYQFWNKELKPYLKDLKVNLAWKESLKNLTEENFEGVILNDDYEFFDDDDRNYAHDIINTISAITNKEIKLSLQKSNTQNKNCAYVYYDKSEKCFKIVVDPNDKLVNYKTQIEHEYSHVLWETSFDQFFKLMDKWIDDMISELKKEGKLK